MKWLDELQLGMYGLESNQSLSAGWWRQCIAHWHSLAWPDCRGLSTHVSMYTIVLTFLAVLTRK